MIHYSLSNNKSQQPNKYNQFPISHVDDPPKKRSRLKRKQMEIVRIITKKCNLFKDLAHDRLKWWNRIHVAGPNIVVRTLWSRWGWVSIVHYPSLIFPLHPQLQPIFAWQTLYKIQNWYQFSFEYFTPTSKTPQQLQPISFHTTPIVT